MFDLRCGGSWEVNMKDGDKRVVMYEHHGNIVKVMAGLKGKHREACLCFQGCANFHPEDRERNCDVANDVYRNCMAHGIVTPVWECPYYVKKMEVAK